MLPYPSDAWFERASRTLAGDAGVARLGADVQLVLQQTVTSADGPAAWHIRVDHGTVTLGRGAATDATVTFTCDAETARAIHEGSSSAQAAFMAGRLRVGGDVGALLRYPELLGALAGALGPVRMAAG